MIALLCAVPAERRALAPLAGPAVTLHVSGIGPEAAARAAEAVGATRPASLISVGFCGALHPGLHVGDLVAPDEVLDRGTGERFTPDPWLLERLPGRRGTLTTAGRLARTPGEREELDGVAVDMESAAVARVARRRRIPFAALRAVTDEVRHRLPDLDACTDSRGRLVATACAAHLARHPADIPALFRLGPAAATAGRALRSGVRDLLVRLGPA